MRKEYDFSQGKRGAGLPSPAKTRVTIMLDDDVLLDQRKDGRNHGQRQYRA